MSNDTAAVMRYGECMAANTVLRFFSLFECIFIPNIRRKHLTFYPMWCIITLYNCRIMSEGGERNGQKQTDRRLRRLAAPSAHRIRADAGRHGARAGNLKKDPRRHRKRAFLSRLDRQCRSLPSFRRQRSVAPRPFVRSRAGSRRAALAFTACRHLVRYGNRLSAACRGQLSALAGGRAAWALSRGAECDIRALPAC